MFYYLVGACKGLRRGYLSVFVFPSIYSVSSSCVFFQISVMYSSSDRILVVGVFPLAFIICGILFRINLL